MMSDIVDSIVMLTGAEYRKMMAEIAASNHFAVKYLAHIDEQNVEVARLTAENAKLRAALEPFARLYLWPFDNHLAKEIMADDDWCEEENDATEEEVFIRRKYIRIARAVFLGDNHE